MHSEVLHIALGGTISMRVVDGLAVPTLGGAQLAELAGITTSPVDLATVGGPQLTYAVMVRLITTLREAEARGVPGVIVTLGTDAMEEVSAFLAYTGPWNCTIAITGSMEPGAESGSDGPQNLRDAYAVASGTRLPEPVLVFAGRIALARAVVKVSGVARDAFASPTAPSWTVAEVLSANGLPGVDAPPPLLGPPGEETVDVPIVVSALSVGGGEDFQPTVYAPALVCVAGGAGSLTPEANAIAEAALAAGSVVAVATRALDARMSAGYGYPGGSGTLVARGAVLTSGMSPHRARIFLLIGVSQGLRGIDLSSRLAEHVAAL